MPTSLELAARHLSYIHKRSLFCNKKGIMSIAFSADETRMIQLGLVMHDNLYFNLILRPARLHFMIMIAGAAGKSAN